MPSRPRGRAPESAPGSSASSAVVGSSVLKATGHKRHGDHHNCLIPPRSRKGSASSVFGERNPHFFKHRDNHLPRVAPGVLMKHLTAFVILPDAHYRVLGVIAIWFPRICLIPDSAQLEKVFSPKIPLLLRISRWTWIIRITESAVTIFRFRIRRTMPMPLPAFMPNETSSTALIIGVGNTFSSCGISTRVTRQRRQTGRPISQNLPGA